MTLPDEHERDGLRSGEPATDRGEQITGQSPKNAVIALFLLVPAPSLGTWMAMVAAPETPLGQALFAASKLWILILPIVWCKFVEGRSLAFPRIRRDGLPAGTVSGVLIAAAITAGYALIGPGWIDEDTVKVELEKVGFDSRTFYIAMACYWCAVNSLLEEYVWRWFVFSRCAQIWKLRMAAVMAGLFFTLHHIVALQVYFEWFPVIVSALGVWIGGTTWSWIYGRWRNIWAAWVSHVFADIAVFVIGYRMLFG